MSTVLTRDPLLTSRSFIQGHHVELAPPADPRTRPLAYAYSAEWDGTPASLRVGGHFDEDRQIWVLPPDVPQAGIATHTSTSCYQGSDTCRDDTCS